MRRKPPGERADGTEKRGRADERWRVARLDAEEQRRHELRSPQAEASADENADADERGHAREHETHDAGRRGAERHADPDLGPASRYGVRRDAVQPEAG